MKLTMGYLLGGKVLPDVSQDPAVKAARYSTNCRKEPEMHTPGKLRTWQDGEAYPDSGIEKWVIETEEDDSGQVDQIAVVESPEDGDAARLVMCWNSHDELVKALEAFMQGIPDRKAIQALLERLKGE